MPSRDDDDRRLQRRVRGGRPIEREVGREQVGVLSERPADDDRDHRQRRGDARQAVALGPHQPQGQRARERGDDHHRQPTARGQPVVERARVRAQDQQAADRDDAARPARAAAPARGTPRARSGSPARTESPAR